MVYITLSFPDHLPTSKAPVVLLADRVNSVPPVNTGQTENVLHSQIKLAEDH